MPTKSQGIGGEIPITPLEKTRLEKAAQDAGFDLSSECEGPWLIFRSTAFAQPIGLSVQADHGYRLALSDAIVAQRIGSEFGIKVIEIPSPWAMLLEGILDYPTLHRLFQRIATIYRVTTGDGLKEFKKIGLQNIDATEAVRLAVQRIGQNIFRASLLAYWGGQCPISGLSIPELLRASHIKPWAECSSNEERLDVFNGLLLSPQLDALFDGGWVTFQDSGQIQIATELDTASRKRLGLTGAELIAGLTTKHCHYLEWHRTHCFRSFKP